MRYEAFNLSPIMRSLRSLLTFRLLEKPFSSYVSGACIMFFLQCLCLPLWISCTSSAPKSPTRLDIPKVVIDANQLQKCPNGHSELKDVRIVYGLVRYENEKDRKEAEKRQENLEYVLGGCCVDNDSPKIEVICKTCRFSFHQSSRSHHPYGYWSIVTTNQAYLGYPLRDITKSFPLPHAAKLTKPVSYDQTLDDQYKLSYEGYSYETSLKPQQIMAQMLPWLKQKNISTVWKEEGAKDEAGVSSRYSLGMDTSARFSVSIYYDSERKQSSVWVAFY